MKRLQKLCHQVHESVLDEMVEALKNGEKHVLSLIDISDDIQIDIEINDYVEEVCVFNGKHLDRLYPNVEERIIESLPLWEEAEKEFSFDTYGFKRGELFFRM